MGFVNELFKRSTFRNIYKLQGLSKQGKNIERMQDRIPSQMVGKLNPWLIALAFTSLICTGIYKGFVQSIMRYPHVMGYTLRSITRRQSSPAVELTIIQNPFSKNFESEPQPPLNNDIVNAMYTYVTCDWCTYFLICCVLCLL